MKKTGRRNMIMLFISVWMSMVILAGCSNTNSDTVVDETTSTVSETVIETSEVETTTTVQEETTVENGETVEMTAGTYPDGSSPVFSDVRLKLTIDGQEVIVRMYDNTAVDAFLELLPLEGLNFFDLSGIEKPVERPDTSYPMGEETPGYDPVTGDMVIYRPWGNFTFFYGDFRYSDELVPLGQIEEGLDILAGQTEDFSGTLEIME